MCRRHFEKQYTDLEMTPPPPSKDKYTPDLSLFSDEELSFLAKLHAAIAALGKHPMAKYKNLS